jgi:hypothetical protein
MAASLLGEPLGPEVTWTEWLAWCARHFGRAEVTEELATWILWERTPWPMGSPEQVKAQARRFFIEEAL